MTRQERDELIEQIAVFLEERSLAGAARRIREEFLTRATSADTDPRDVVDEILRRGVARW